MPVRTPLPGRGFYSVLLPTNHPSLRERGPGLDEAVLQAKVIIGGQMLCLLLSLLVTPISYSIFDDWSHGRFFGRRRVQKPASENVPEAAVPVPGK